MAGAIQKDITWLDKGELYAARETFVNEETKIKTLNQTREDVFVAVIFLEKHDKSSQFGEFAFIYPKKNVIVVCHLPNRTCNHIEKCSSIANEEEIIQSLLLKETSLSYAKGSLNLINLYVVDFHEVIKTLISYTGNNVIFDFHMIRFTNELAELAPLISSLIKYDLLFYIHLYRPKMYQDFISFSLENENCKKICLDLHKNRINVYEDFLHVCAGKVVYWLYVKYLENCVVNA